MMGHGKTARCVGHEILSPPMLSSYAADGPFRGRIRQVYPGRISANQCSRPCGKSGIKSWASATHGQRRGTFTLKEAIIFVAFGFTLIVLLVLFVCVFFFVFVFFCPVHIVPLYSGEHTNHPRTSSYTIITRFKPMSGTVEASVSAIPRQIQHLSQTLCKTRTYGKHSLRINVRTAPIRFTIFPFTPRSVCPPPYPASYGCAKPCAPGGGGCVDHPTVRVMRRVRKDHEMVREQFITKHLGREETRTSC